MSHFLGCNPLWDCTCSRDRPARLAADAGVPTGLAEWEASARPIVQRWQRQTEKVASERSLSGTRHPGHDLAIEATTHLEAV